MKLVVGLGNVGSRYAHTRHNLGFMVIDALAQQLSASSWKAEAKLKAAVATASIATPGSAAGPIILAKPDTMMNLSGEAVQRLMQHYRVPLSQVWVLADDVDVPFGRLRLRAGGGSGQQGLRSITAAVGADCVRGRLGISLNDRAVEPSEVYVLKPFTAQEQAQLPTLIATAATALAEQLATATSADTTFNLLPDVKNPA